MKNKFFIILIAFLSLLCISSGLYGYKLNQDKINEEKQKKINEEKDVITYIYYLEDTKVDTIPNNKTEDGIEDNKYQFSKYSCTNEIVGEFNTNEWKFNVTSGTKGTCELYFVNSYYEVTLSPIINAVLDEKNLTQVERDKDGVFIINPNEGYKYKESICTNNKSGEWDSSTNTFTLKSVMSDISCEIKFEKKLLNIEIVVKKGTGNTTETVEYGESKSILVTPDQGYDNPTIVCTNEQTAIFENNSLNFEKLTNDTKCTITFVKAEIKKYTLTVSNPSEFEEISIVEGNSTISNILEGTDVSLTLQSNNENASPNLSCKYSDGRTIIPTIDSTSDTVKKFTILGVNNNITCKIEKNN